MNGYLLDTDVVSELTKGRPNQAIVDFLNTQDDLWLSAIGVEGLELGIQLLPGGHRRARLRAWLSLLLADFESRILPIGRREAECAAALRARVHREGGELELGDALIAGTAMAYDMAIVTRNVKDFGDLDLTIINPWES